MEISLLSLCNYVMCPEKKDRKEWTVTNIVHRRDHFCNKHSIERKRPSMISQEQKLIFATSGDSRPKGWDTLQAITKQIVGSVVPELVTPTRAQKFLSTLL